MSRLGTILTAAAVIGCGSVKPSLDGKSEGDEVRDRALAVFIDRSTTDRIDGDDGDNTDWKYVDVIDKGRLSITVSIDAPDKLSGAEIAVHDEFGSRLERLLVVDNQTNYVFGTEVEKIPNKYFVKIFTMGGTSAYTVGVRLAYAPDPTPPRPVAPAPAPAPVYEPEPEPVRKAPTIRKRAPERPPAPRPPPVAEPEPVAKSSVTGRVVRVTPSEDASYVTLSVRVDGPVAKGAVGEVYKGGENLGSGRVTRGGNKTISVRVDKAPGKFTGGLTVKF